MTEDQPPQQTEAERGRLGVVARHVLGSAAEADGTVAEAWRRLARAEPGSVDDPRAWLTAETVRLCLDRLGSQEAPGAQADDAEVADDPDCREDEHLLSPQLAAALTVVQDTLAPAERVAFVLHDLVGTPYDEVGAALGRSSVAAQQLAARARRRVQAPDRSLEAERTVHERVVQAFLAAAADDDVDELVWLLHPDATLRGDGPAARVGAEAVAATFADRAAGARPVLLDGFAAAVAGPAGEPGVVFGFTVVDGRVAEVELLTAPATLDLAPA